MSEKVKATVTLAARAMLVSLGIKKWGAKAEDKSVTNDIHAQKNAVANAGKYNKNLLDKRHLETLTKLVSEARTYHASVTLPWSEKGARILPSELFLDYQNKMDDIKARWDVAVQDFLDEYPQMVKDRQNELNGLYNADDYPTVDALKNKFSFGHQVHPIPTADDFRVDLGEAELQRVRNELEKENENVMASTAKEVCTRLFDHVSRMAESLSSFDPSKKGKDRGTFRDSVVTNLEDLVKILPSQNLTGDPDINRMIEEAKDKLTQLSADDLRKNDKAREDTAEAAANIAKEVESKMSAMGDIYGS